jgi:hypothetical protein
MTKLQEIQNFYLNGVDPAFVATPNHIFIKTPNSAERVVLVPGHFYTFQELNPVPPEDVPTVDEVELMKYPTKREDQLIAKYAKTKKPYYDNRPIFLYLGNDLGLNVKLMNQGLRKKFIRTYLSVVQAPLAGCYDTEGNLIDFGTRIRSLEVRPFFSVNLALIKQIIGMPDLRLGLLVNKYKRENMQYLTMIDWDDVPKLHLANYSTDRTISMRSNFSLIEIK